MGRLYKIGELASVTGLTTRTLHHYEDVGLLSPTERTEAGPGVRASLQKMYESEGPENASRGMVDPELMAWVASAQADGA